MLICDIYYIMNLDGYVLYEPVGFGAKGPIWRAVDQQGRNFALQVLGAQLPPGVEERIATLQKMASKYVLRIEQLRKVTDGRFVVLSEFLEGQNLEILRAGRRFTPEQLGFIGRSLAQGLADLHQAGLLHGDISPANAVVTVHGRVLWVDVLGSAEGTTLAFQESRSECGKNTSAREEVFAFAQMMLALGMDPQLLGRALHPDPIQRPSVSELCQAWQSLPTAGIDLLTPNELTTAKMRAAGRDVATTLEHPPSSLEPDCSMASSPRRSRRSAQTRDYRGNRRNQGADNYTAHGHKLLKIAIPALGGAAAILSAVLLVSRLLPAADALPETKELTATGASNTTALPRPGEILTSNSGGANKSESAQELESETTPEPERNTESGSKSETNSETESEAEDKSGNNPPQDSTPLPQTPSAPENLLPPAGPETPATGDLLKTGKITDNTEAAAVLQELLSLRDKALASGDARELANLTVPASVAQKADADLLSRLKSSQTRINGLATVVKSAEIISADKTQVRLRVTLAQGAYTQTDRIGNQHQVVAIPDAQQEMLLMKHPWRISSVVRLR